MKKENEFISKIIQKTTNTGRNALEEVQKNVSKISEKIKEDKVSRQLKKYNPIFSEQFFDKSVFNIPNVIEIVDDAVRRGINVCEGAIGWLEKRKDIEVLCLYDEFIKDCGIQFIPAPICDNIYYVDCYNRNTFISLDYIFNKSHEERIAELKHIAFSLGAKSCSIQIIEKSIEHTSGKRTSVSGETFSNGVSATEELDQSYSSNNSSIRNGKVVVKFKGNKKPVVPELKWFQHDQNIKRLIEMRCANPSSIKNEKLEISGASSSTMSQKTVAALSGTLPTTKISSAFNLEAQLKKELSTKLVFELVF